MIGSDFELFDLGSSQVSGHSGSDRVGVSSRLISVHLKFQVILFRIRLCFGLSNLRSSRISSRSGLDQVGF
jgi:hypothetical protein